MFCIQNTLSHCLTEASVTCLPWTGGGGRMALWFVVLQVLSIATTFKVSHGHCNGPLPNSSMPIQIWQQDTDFPFNRKFINIVVSQCGYAMCGYIYTSIHRQLTRTRAFLCSRLFDWQLKMNTKTFCVTSRAFACIYVYTYVYVCVYCYSGGIEFHHMWYYIYICMIQSRW